MASQPYHSLSPEEAYHIGSTTSINDLSTDSSSHTGHKEPVTPGSALVVAQSWVDWKWELVASFFLPAIPIIIVGTLYPHANQPIPQWPAHISPNSLLSVYSVVFRACLTFIVTSCIGQLQWTWFSSDRPRYDMVRYTNAASGPWGSLQMIWSQGTQQPLTTLGAIILVLSIAVDPFIQQIFKQTDCATKVTSEKAILPRTNLLDTRGSEFGSVNDPFSTHAFPSLESPDYNPEDFLSWQCLTGNCTFSKIYGTLGFCSSCEDVSAHVTVTNTSERHSGTGCHEPVSSIWSPFVSMPCDTGVRVLSSLYLGDDIRHNLNWSSWIKEEWINMTFDPRPFGAPTDVAIFNSWTASTLFGTVILKGATSYPDRVKDLLTGTSTTGCDRPDALDEWYCRGYGAASCILQPCVRFYNATIDGGHFSEHLISQSGPIDWEFFKNIDEYDIWGIVDTECTSQDEIHSLKEQGYTVHSRWLPYYLSNVIRNGLIDYGTLGFSLLEHECLYGIHGGPGSLFAAGWFVRNMNGTLQAEILNNSYTRLALQDDVDGPPRITQILYNETRMEFDSIERAFVNISDMATAWVRMNGKTNFSNPAIGDVHHHATCLRAHWAWIAFPGTLALLTLALFVMVMAHTTARQVPIWKSSPLAWVIRWRHNYLNPGSSLTATIDDMERISKGISVALAKGPDLHIIQMVNIQGAKESSLGEMFTNQNTSALLGGPAQE
ncbi:hypothetical protein F4803DRAFT_557741 [Xylaria telfairii]|nr:hypothetical protein F4803DRAFT_557741 [Xylaria telfairii]